MPSLCIACQKRNMQSCTPHIPALRRKKSVRDGWSTETVMALVASPSLNQDNAPTEQRSMPLNTFATGDELPQGNI